MLGLFEHVALSPAASCCLACNSSRQKYYLMIAPNLDHQCLDSTDPHVRTVHVQVLAPSALTFFDLAHRQSCHDAAGKLQLRLLREHCLTVGGCDGRGQASSCRTPLVPGNGVHVRDSGSGCVPAGVSNGCGEVCCGWGLSNSEWLKSVTLSQENHQTYTLTVRMQNTLLFYTIQLKVTLFCTAEMGMVITEGFLKPDTGPQTALCPWWQLTHGAPQLVLLSD